MKILICYGTRPEWIKIEPIINKLKDKIDFEVLYTGQHKDIGKYFFDLNIDIENYSENRLNNILFSILKKFKKRNFTHVMVQGDTASALAIALASFNNSLKIIHLEAGLRTNDKSNPYPEEIYRQIISRLTDIHLCPTEINKNNLINENINDKIYVVGNTLIDSLINFKKDIIYNDDILVTLHRRENHINIKKWFCAIKDLSEKFKDLNFILFKHPNPNVSSYYDIFQNSRVHLSENIEHNKMINYIKNCKLLISDSGGLQEEASFFNKKIIVCRKTTERIETLNLSSFLCNDPNNLETIFKNHIYNYKINFICPYGDGDSSNKILDILKNNK